MTTKLHSSPVSQYPGFPSATRIIQIRPQHPLLVCHVNICTRQNGIDHHTSAFDLMTRLENPQLVVRRGECFQLDLHFNRPYYPDLDQITFKMALKDYEKPVIEKGTFASVSLAPKCSEDTPGWGAEYEPSVYRENYLKVYITSSSHCSVGVWNLEVDTQLKQGDGVLNFRLEPTIYILFNPWCSEDQVYLSEEDKRQEYVMADAGRIWKGSSSRMQPATWIYAQFEKDILECALCLVTKIGQVPLIDCNNPIKVTRALTAALNNRQKGNRDRGVLADSWDEVTCNETNHPNNCAGSRTILQNFYRNWCNHDASRNRSKFPNQYRYFDLQGQYGQCWVFAGVFTTVCRALGIPCRPVTAYTSGHETKGRLSINEVYDDHGNSKKLMSDDSVWTFHVWNEIWMKRPDLGDGYDGWNALDATPQEESDGVFQCGPASIKAIQKGDTFKPYDTEFVIGAMNVEKMFWKYCNPLEPLSLIKADSHVVDHGISTKAIGSWNKEDISENYKVEQKLETTRVLNKSLHTRFPLNQHHLDRITVSILLIDDVLIGSPFSVTAVITSMEDEDVPVTALLRVDVKSYCTRLEHLVTMDRQDITLKKGSDTEFMLNVDFKDYYEKLVDQCNFKVICLVQIKGSRLETIATENFRLRIPEVNMNVAGGLPTVGEEFTVTASFINPLPVPLTNSRYRFEGAGLNHDADLYVDKKSINPNEEAKVTFRITPGFVGMRMLAAKFYSEELKDVEGVVELTVKDKPRDTAFYAYLGTNLVKLYSLF